MRLDMAAKSDFEIDDLTLDIMRLSMRDNMAIVKPLRAKPYWKFLMTSSALDLIPFILVLLRLLQRALRAFLAGSSDICRRLVVLAVMAVLISPLFLHLLAFDADRFNVYASLVLFLALLLICQRLPGVTFEFSKVEKIAFILTIAFNLVAVYGVIDVKVADLLSSPGHRIVPYTPLP